MRQERNIEGLLNGTVADYILPIETPDLHQPAEWQTV